MDETTAWKNFVQSGSVNDYLTYCRIRLGCPPTEENREESEDMHENDYRGSGPDVQGRWR